MAFSPLRWRRLFPRLTPAFLHRGDGGRVLSVLMAIQDAFLERAYQGLNARFPRSLDAEALRLQGQDRQIVRGRNETLAHYAVRLKGWRQEHRLRGSSWALLRQVQEYFREADGTGWEMYTIDANGARWHLDTDGTESVTYGEAWDWDGEAVGATNWARAWLVIIPPMGAVTATPDFGDADLYGGALYSDEYAVGHEGISARDAKAVREIVELWKPEGIRSVQAVISIGGADPAPDGTWGEMSVLEDPGGSGVFDRVPNERAGFRFWFLSKAERCITGDGTAWYDGDVYVPGDGKYTPDGSTWDPDVTFPDGAVYQGDASAWPGDLVPLVDDGDVPV